MAGGGNGQREVADLDADYAAAGYGKRLGIGRAPALVIVDFVQAYLEPSSPLYAGVEETRQTCVRLLQGCRTAGIPVFHTNVKFTADGTNGGIFTRKVKALEVFFEGDTRGLGRFADGLEPLAGEPVITKQYPSAFFGTALSPALVSKGIDTVIIAGLSTSGCIRATAVDAMQYGFVSVVAGDAVGDRDRRPHEANLFDLAAKYCDVLTTDEILKHLDKARAA